MQPSALTRGQRQLAALRVKGPKYRNRKTTVNGITFDSKREADRYLELKPLADCGVIQHLELQKTFRLEVNGVLICRYRCDFAYRVPTGNDWPMVVEDSKGYRTDVYRLKKKLMKAIYGIEIREV